LQKDTTLENVRNENDQLNGELKRLRNEIQHLQSVHDASVSEVRALKFQLDDKFLTAANSPPVIAVRKFRLDSYLVACLGVETNYYFFCFFYTYI